MFKCSCRRMKCDEGSDAWNNLRISHIQVFLKSSPTCTAKEKHGVRESSAKENHFFLAKMTFSRWKNLEQPSYIHDYFWSYIQWVGFFVVKLARVASPQKGIPTYRTESLRRSPHWTLSFVPWRRCLGNASVNVRVMGCRDASFSGSPFMGRLRHRQVTNSWEFHRICRLTVVINMAFWEDETASMSVISFELDIGLPSFEGSKNWRDKYRACRYQVLYILWNLHWSWSFTVPTSSGTRREVCGVVFPPHQWYVVYVMYAHYTDPWNETVKAGLLVVVVDSSG